MKHMGLRSVRREICRTLKKMERWETVAAPATDAMRKSMEELWGTDSHRELSVLREKYFGRFSDTAETLTGGKAMKYMSRDVKAMGGLKAVPHAVGVHPLVLRLSDIDELNQIAKLDGFIMMKWHEEDMDDVPVGAELSPEDVSIPAFPRISSAIETEVKEPTAVYHCRNPGDPIGTVYATYEFKADVEVEFNLYHFPFDYQNISLVLWFSGNGDPRTPDYGRFVIPLPADDSGKDPSSILPLRAAAAEWRLFSPTIKAWTQSEKLSKTPCRKQGITLEIPILRKSEFYVNMLSIMCLIASLAFCAFSAHPTQIGERLASTFSLLLALIAFKFSVADKLPRVAYLTAFDRYMHVAFGFLGFLAVYFALMKVWDDAKRKKVEAAPVVETIKEDAKEGKENDAATEEEEEKKEATPITIPDWVFEPQDFERRIALPTFLAAWIAYHIIIMRNQRNRVSDVQKVLKSEIRRFKWTKPKTADGTRAQRNPGGPGGPEERDTAINAA
eukprot:TRINITY_DN8087_c0_g1_i1.p1 TRINITY_DN8087_c0_g1~~TRINITY_DN8087_c0_g1_i1.p1  ORF type:complete len:502 (+),score=129.13 TRINITY_DN8087_c0_g1_i1:56-1561(+)